MKFIHPSYSMPILMMMLPTMNCWEEAGDDVSVQALVLTHLINLLPFLICHLLLDRFGCHLFIPKVFASELLQQWQQEQVTKYSIGCRDVKASQEIMSNCFISTESKFGQKPDFMFENRAIEFPIRYTQIHSVMFLRKHKKLFLHFQRDSYGCQCQ